MAVEQFIVDKIVFQQLMHEQRQDIKKKICSSKEACFILGVERKVFMELCRDPKTKIKKTKIIGKYSLESIYQEADRLIEN